MMPSRKTNKPDSFCVKISPIIVYAALFLSFVFANLYVARSELMLLDYYANSLGYAISFPSGVWGYVIMLVTEGAISIIITEVVMMFYYFIAFRAMRGMVPFSAKEFKANLRPFIVLRNILWGALMLLCFLQSGYFIELGMMFFETLATMIMIIPFFYYMKKLYIADGYGKLTLLSFVLPFAVMNSVNIISGLL